MAENTHTKSPLFIRNCNQIQMGNYLRVADVKQALVIIHPWLVLRVRRDEHIRQGIGTISQKVPVNYMLYYKANMIGNILKGQFLDRHGRELWIVTGPKIKKITCYKLQYLRSCGKKPKSILNLCFKHYKKLFGADKL